MLAGLISTRDVPGGCFPTAKQALHRCNSGRMNVAQFETHLVRPRSCKKSILSIILDGPSTAGDILKNDHSSGVKNDQIHSEAMSR